MSAWNCEPMMPTFTLPSAIASLPQIRSSAAKAGGPATSLGRQDRRPGLRSALVVAADILLENPIAFVLELIVNADLGRVIAAHGKPFQFNEEAHFGKIGHVIVIREHLKDSDPFIWARVNKGFPVVMAAH